MYLSSQGFKFLICNHEKLFHRIRLNNLPKKRKIINQKLFDFDFKKIFFDPSSNILQFGMLLPQSVMEHGKKS